jgi:methyl-accepting chemotaxis protein WspA
MRNLKLWQKMTVLGIVFLIPFAFVTTQLMRELAGGKIERADREIAGTKFYVALIGLMKEMQNQRDLAAGSEVAALASVRKNNRLRASDALKNASDVFETSGLDVADQWTSVSENTRAAQHSTNGIHGSHTQVITEITDLIGGLSESASWGQDPDGARSYLQSVIRIQGPEAAIALSDLRELGLQISMSQQAASPDQQNRLLANLFRLRNRLGQGSTILDQIGKAVVIDTELDLHLKIPRQELYDAALGTVGEVMDLVNTGGRSKRSPVEFNRTITATLDKLYTVMEAAATAMMKSVQAERDAASTRYIRTIVLAALFIIAAAIFAWFVMRDISRPLEHLVSSADVVASGDLSVRIPFENRKDELGVLVSSFNGMVFSLNRIVSQVQKSGIQVNTSINQISVTSGEQQTAARQIADTTVAIGDTANKISNTSQEVVNMMKDAFAVTGETTDLAGKGQDGLTRMRETMQQITEAATLIHTKLDVLNEKASNINQVITTITKIADRTNLLSLNAAIEAEKAGEYGRGFSVVATEIRRLADQTAVATYDIEQMVKEMQAAVTTGVMAMNKFSDEVRQGVGEVQQIGTQLDQIISQVQALTPRFELVNEGVNSQASGGQNISESLTQLSKTVQQTARSLEESNDAVEQLKNAAYGLRDGVARFKLPR